MTFEDWADIAAASPNTPFERMFFSWKAEREKLIGALGMAATECRFMKMAINAQDPPSELLLRCKDARKRILAVLAEVKGLEREVRDSLSCPRCAGIFHDRDIQEKPDEFWQCPSCHTWQHEKCRGLKEKR